MLCRHLVRWYYIIRIDRKAVSFCNRKGLLFFWIKDNNKKRLRRLIVWVFSGWRRIRTFESVANRFTVCPLWPLGNPSLNRKSLYMKYQKNASVFWKKSWEILWKVCIGLTGQDIFLYKWEFYRTYIILHVIFLAK